MSEADRVPPEAASAEAESSKLASAGHKRDGRMPFGVKGKLPRFRQSGPADLRRDRSRVVRLY